MKIITPFLALALLVLPFHLWAGDKVTICHATSSATNPYVEITVSVNAIGAHFDEHGTPLAGHEEDLLLGENEHCPGPVIVDPPPPPPVDGTTTPPIDQPPPTYTGGGGGSSGGGSGGGTQASPHTHSSTGGSVASATCAAVTAPQNVKIDTGIPNDHKLSVLWTPVANATEVEIRYGHEDGKWLSSFTAPNTGSYELTGLTNGMSYWVQVRAYNDCSEGEWSVSIDPLP